MRELSCGGAAADAAAAAAKQSNSLRGASHRSKRARAHWSQILTRLIRSIKVFARLLGFALCASVFTFAFPLSFSFTWLLAADSELERERELRAQRVARA